MCVCCVCVVCGAVGRQEGGDRGWAIASAMSGSWVSGGSAVLRLNEWWEYFWTAGRSSCVFGKGSQIITFFFKQKNKKDEKKTLKAVLKCSCLCAAAILARTLLWKTLFSSIEALSRFNKVRFEYSDKQSKRAHRYQLSMTEICACSMLDQFLSLILLPAHCWLAKDSIESKKSLRSKP